MRDDGSLTAQERAALANLEAAAETEDPHLAARLQGLSRFHLIARLPKVPVWLRSRWWGAPVVVAGLVLVVVGLSTGWVVGTAGAVIAASGLWLVVGAIDEHWIHRARPAPPP
jgi:VIT1/CCC1 family predicted Fe2+/Mn2+ transporter